MNELVEKIESLMDDFKKNAQDFVTKGNKSAARRARKFSLEIEKELKVFRKTSIEAEKQ